MLNEWENVKRNVLRVLPPLRVNITPIIRCLLLAVTIIIPILTKLLLLPHAPPVAVAVPADFPGRDDTAVPVPSVAVSIPADFPGHDDTAVTVSSVSVSVRADFPGPDKMAVPLPSVSTAAVPATAPASAKNSKHESVHVTHIPGRPGMSQNVLILL
jgi:hypothetical protein